MASAAKPVLYLVVCGGSAAVDLPGLVELLLEQGWEICVMASPAGLAFLDCEVVQVQTGHLVRSRYRQLEEPDAVPAPDAMAVVPATFNTVNKLALGINDTLALGLLNKAIGLGLPTLICPTPGPALVHHPILGSSLDTLRSWGVRVLFDDGNPVLPLLDPSADGNDSLSWDRVAAAIAELLPVTHAG